MNILKDNVRPMYLHFLTASLGSAMVGSVFGLVDAMMVGQYHGPMGTAALSVFNPLWSLVYSLGFLAGIGGSVLFANARGRGDEESAGEYFSLSLIYGLILSFLAMLLIGLFSRPLLSFFGAKGDEALLSMTMNYLRPVWFAIPACIFSNIQAAYLRNDANPGLAMRAVLIGGAFNIVGDYLCIFVLDMGIFGAGLATAIGMYVGNIIMLRHYFSPANTLRLVKASRVGQKLWRISAAGFSSAINDLAMGVSGILINRQIMKYMGMDALSVYGVLTQMIIFAQCCAYGTGQAAQPILSQNFGARQHSRVKACLKYGLVTSAVFGLVWLLLVELAPELFVRVFMTPTEAVLDMAPGILRVYGPGFLLLPFNLFATYYFQSIMRPDISMLASVGRGLVVNGCFILLLPALFGAEALWLSMFLTELVIALFCLWHMLRLTKKLDK